jgi:hypothetical protein
MVDRYAWEKTVRRADLPDRAKVLATALAFDFFNEKDGKMCPGLPTLAEATRKTEDTVKRARDDLIEAGFLRMKPGRGRGNFTQYFLTVPAGVAVVRTVEPKWRTSKRGEPSSGNYREEEGNADEERVQICSAKHSGKEGSAATKRVHHCYPHIKKEHLTEHKETARPFPQRDVRVREGTWEGAEWDEWLDRRGYPDLAHLPALRIGESYSLPSRSPPRNPLTYDYTVAIRVIEWALTVTGTRRLEEATERKSGETRRNSEKKKGKENEVSKKMAAGVLVAVGSN